MSRIALQNAFVVESTEKSLDGISDDREKMHSGIIDRRYVKGHVGHIMVGFAQTESGIIQKYFKPITNIFYSKIKRVFSVYSIFSYAFLCLLTVSPRNRHERGEIAKVDNSSPSKIKIFNCNI